MDYNGIAEYIENSKKVLELPEMIERGNDHIGVRFQKEEDKSWTIFTYPTKGTVTEGGLVGFDPKYVSSVKGVKEQDICEYMINFYENNKIIKSKDLNHDYSSYSAIDDLEIFFNTNYLDPENQEQFLGTLNELRNNSMNARLHY